MIIEIGSGGGSFALCIFKTGKGKVGVYTIDWDDRRVAHLKQDFRQLKWESLLSIFPKLIHVHFTWDCMRVPEGTSGLAGPIGHA